MAGEEPEVGDKGTLNLVLPFSRRSHTYTTVFTSELDAAFKDMSTRHLLYSSMFEYIFTSR